MLTIILPGYSSKNKDWLEDTASQIHNYGEIRPVYWGHWEDPNSKFDPKVKAHLLDNVSGKGVVDIIAKSIGTLVAAYLIQKDPVKIRKIIFCGVPLNDISEDEKEVIKAALRLIPIKNMLFFQNNEDPHAGSGSLKVFLSEFGRDIEVISKPRADHEYFYQNEFNKYLLG